MQNSNQKLARTTRIRARIKTSLRPRLTLFRSARHIWAQLINDQTGQTLVSVNTKALPAKPGETKTIRAGAVGTEIARLAKEKKITKIVFDRGAYKFHGRVKAVAESARAGGLEF